jgi:hypothetical protein
MTIWHSLIIFQAVFSLYDKDNSGCLSAFELRQALNSAGYRLNNLILHLLAHRDSTNNGMITFDDFMMCAVRLKAMIGELSHSALRKWCIVCVCVCERERERGGGEGERERERELYVLHCMPEVKNGWLVVFFISPCKLCGEQNGTVMCNAFPSIIYHSISTAYSFVTHGWYSSTISGCGTKESTHTPP